MKTHTLATRAGQRRARQARWAELLGASLTLHLAACSNDTTTILGTPNDGASLQPAQGPQAGGSGSVEEGGSPLYLAASWVTDAELTNTYVSVFDSLDIERLDFGAALEIPGFGDAWVFEKWVFIADGETPRVGRYTLSERGALELDVELDFSNYGALGATFWDQQILSPTKAYLSNARGREYIVWNPTTMEITGTVPWPEFGFAAGLDVLNSYTDRGGVVRDGYFFHGFYAHDEDFLAFGDSSVVLVYDIETDELVTTIDVPCPMMDVASLSDDGHIYVSGWSYIPLSYLAGYSPNNCAARIDVSTRALDPSWSLNYSDIDQGDQGSALRVVSGNDGVFAMFHGTDVPVTEGMDIWDLDVGENDWELYSIDLARNTVAPTGIKMGDGSYYESHVDDRYFVYLALGFADTRVYERTRSGYEPRFEAQGWMSRLFRLR
jgi:hypothetical protein